jgi:hypothetical protein
MTVVTRQRTENFALVPNAVAEDDRLSFEARGLLVYLLCKPNNWKVRITDIQNAGGIGRDKTYRLLKELRDVGYIVLDIRRGAGARIEEQNYIVYDCAIPGRLPFPEKPEQAALLPENPEMGKPLPDFPDRETPDAGKAGRFNKNPYLIKPIRYNDEFAAFWATVAPANRPADPGVAQAIFRNLPADIDRVNAVKLWESYREIIIKRGKPPKLLVYLKAKAWRELVDAPPTDKDGDFIITPDREEWQPWLEAIAATHGDVAAAATKKGGRIVRKDRYPPIEAGRQLSMQMG